MLNVNVDGKANVTCEPTTKPIRVSPRGPHTFLIHVAFPNKNLCAGISLNAVFVDVLGDEMDL